MKREGKLIYNKNLDRMDIRSGMSEYYGGLHCGSPLEVWTEEGWMPTRIEMGNNWYLAGLKMGRLNGITVRI